MPHNTTVLLVNETLKASPAIEIFLPGTDTRFCAPALPKLL